MLGAGLQQRAWAAGTPRVAPLGGPASRRSTLSAGGARLHARSLVPRAQNGVDPYQALGLPRGSDAAAIKRAYKKRLSEAAGDPRRAAQVEAAHTAIVMEGLRARVKGGSSIDSRIRFADRTDWIPWRPRRHAAPELLAKLSLGVQAGLLTWAVIAPEAAGTKPVLYAVCLGGLLNVLKQNAIFPVPQSEEGDKSKQGLWNVLRGFFLAALATFFGCILTFTGPDAITSWLGVAMPDVFYYVQLQLLALGATASNHVMTAYYR